MFDESNFLFFHCFHPHFPLCIQIVDFVTKLAVAGVLVCHNS